MYYYFKNAPKVRLLRIALSRGCIEEGFAKWFNINRWRWLFKVVWIVRMYCEDEAALLGIIHKWRHALVGRGLPNVWQTILIGCMTKGRVQKCEKFAWHHLWMATNPAWVSYYRIRLKNINFLGGWIQFSEQFPSKSSLSFLSSNNPRSRPYYPTVYHYPTYLL